MNRAFHQPTDAVSPLIVLTSSPFVRGYWTRNPNVSGATLARALGRDNDDAVRREVRRSREWHNAAFPKLNAKRVLNLRLHTVSVAELMNSEEPRMARADLAGIH